MLLGPLLFFQRVAQWIFPLDVIEEEKTTRSSESIDRNNAIIIDFLRKYQPQHEKAITAFESYKIRYEEREQGNPYRPLLQLFSDGQVPLHWKKKADEMMRTVIVGEEGGPYSYATGYDALSWYLDCIAQGCEHYEIELLVSQVGFIEELLPTITEKVYIYMWRFDKIYRALKNEEFKEVNHRFVRLMVIDLGQFTAKHDGNRALAHEIMKDFSDDLELKSCLQTIIQKGSLDD